MIFEVNTLKLLVTTPLKNDSGILSFYKGFAYTKGIRSQTFSVAVCVNGSVRDSARACQCA